LVKSLLHSPVPLWIVLGCSGSSGTFWIVLGRLIEKRDQLCLSEEEGSTFPVASQEFRRANCL
jgi:hypothetical protein